jgi:apolipoprotein N-acyltransferase
LPEGQGLYIRYRAYIPALVSGGLLVLCFPVFDYYLLAFVALTPFLISLWRLSPWEAFKAGLFLGLVYFFGTQYWIYHSVSHYGGVPLVLSFFVVLLLAVILSLYTGLFAVLFARTVNRSVLPALLVAPLFWVVLEYARTYVLTGFPWSSIGYSQYKFLPFIQIADITGIYGVSFLVVAVNGVLADSYITYRRQQETPLVSLYPLVIGGVLLLAAVGGSVFYGNHRLEQEIPGEPVLVGVVQGNIRQDLKWEPSYQEEVINIYKMMTRDSAGGKPDFLVWPESALPFYYGRDHARTRDLREFQRSLGVELLFGAITVKEGEDSLSLGNSAILLDAEGSETYAYDKIHLVPFGEYVPYQKVLFFIDKLVTGIGDYRPGSGYLRGSTDAGEFGTHICYEIIFPGLVRKFYRDGGDFMVTITNDAWFGRTAGPYQHWSMAVFRAVENRKPVIRAANTGISGFIDSRGRVLSKTLLFERTVLMERLKTDPTRSVYSRYGDLFVYVLMVGAMLVLVSPKRR